MLKAIFSFWLVLIMSLEVCGQIPSSTGWFQIPNSKIRPISPPNGFGGSGYNFRDQVINHIRAWNSAVFDTTRNRMVTFGGGHMDYFGNELYALDLDDLTITRLTDPGLPIATSCTDSIVGGTQPNSRHTYDALVYMPNVDSLFSFGGAIACAASGSTNTTWVFHFSTNTWEQKNPTGTIPAAVPGIVTAYDPNTGKVFLHDQNSLFTYDPVANVFTRLTNAIGVDYHMTAAIDPVRKRILIVGFGSGSQYGGVVSYDISPGSTYTRTFHQTTGGDIIVNAQYPGLAFDPVSQRIIAWNEGNTVYSFNWDTNVWTPITFTGGPPPRDAQGVSTLGRWEYSPTSGVFVEINSVDNNAYTLRLSTTAGATDVLPNLADEKATYARWGWSWNVSQEPNYPSAPGYVVSNPDIHGDTEGDDLWTYQHQWIRTAQNGFLDRATAWKSYFQNGYVQCSGSSGLNFCYDRDAFGGDHITGWGMIDWYLRTGDTAALNAAISIGAQVESIWSSSSSFGCAFNNGCLHYGFRMPGRHLMLALRLAQVTNDPRWVTLRDFILNKILASPMWDDTQGVYIADQATTDSEVGAGQFAGGARITRAFQIGILVESLYRMYKITGNQTIRTRIIRIANWISQWGLHPQYQYTGSTFGFDKNRVAWHNYSATCGTQCTFWDPVYTTDEVNILVYGYKLSGDVNLLNRAKTFFNRGTKTDYGSITPRTADNAVDHFMDTQFDTSSGNFYLKYNKGELQYTYRIFENGGLPTLDATAPDTTPPSPPTGVRVTP